MKTEKRNRKDFKKPCAIGRRFEENHEHHQLACVPAKKHDAHIAKTAVVKNWDEEDDKGML